MPELALPYFLATPAAGTAAPGVVVIHEGNGISAQLLRFCQRLAGEGYQVIAPDLYFRSGGTESGDPATLYRSVDLEQVQGDLNHAADILRRSGASRVGVTGFCMGGRLTYRCAVAGGFDAAVGFYGAGIAGELGEPTCPTLLFFGGNDPWIPAADIEAVAARHPATTVYPQAGHGFMRDGSENFDPQAASDAYAMLLAHLHANLS